MTPTVNKIFLRGRVKDVHPPIQVGGSHQLIKLTVEVPRDQRQFGLQPAETDTIVVQTWDHLADFCRRSVKPGINVFIEAIINYSTWEDKATGDARGSMVINAIDVCLAENVDINRIDIGSNDF